MDKVLKKSE